MILDRLTTLGHEQRMALFRLLVRRYPDKVPAGELAAALGLKASTLSVYLSALRRVGLVRQFRQGTSVLYRAELGAGEEMIAYLFRDCCRGRPEICPPGLPFDSSAPKKRKQNVLFICRGNSTRSIFAEAILRSAPGDRFRVFSAGSRPRDGVNPIAEDILKSRGHETAALRAKSLKEFQGDAAPEMDFVFTVCDQAANEDCPAWKGQPLYAHWGVAPPSRENRNLTEKRHDFERAFEQIDNRVSAFIDLPLETLGRTVLQQRLDDISRL